MNILTSKLGFKILILVSERNVRNMESPNMDRSALNGALCQWQFYGKGNKLNTFPCIVVVRINCAEKKEQGSNPG